jgi:hypothetical protein
MHDDYYDDDCCEAHDLDASDVTGDPQLDIFGYQSPTRRGQNLTGFTSSAGDYLARSREGRAERGQRRRAAVAQNLVETRRVAQRRDEPQPTGWPRM